MSHPPKRANLPKPTFVIRCEWAATAKTVKVEAKDEQAALVKAFREGCKGCLKATLIRVEDLVR